jgi:hypothetical protein
MEMKFEYILEFNNYPPKCMELLFSLSKKLNPYEAYQILKNIPVRQKTKTLEEINNIRHDIMIYNYTWCLILLNNNIDINIIKILLSNFVDYYYIDLININSVINNTFISYQFMLDLYATSKTRRDTYYTLRQYKIDHITAYNITLLEQKYIDKILSLVKYNYTEIDYLKKAIYFTEEQLDFLKLNRFAFASKEEFKQNMNMIFENLKNHQFISPDNFQLTEKGEFII